MVYDASIRRTTGAQPRLNQEQQEKLAQLERVKRPTPWQRGQLDALRMSTPVQNERARTEALKSKWAVPPTRSTDTSGGGTR